MRLIFAGTPEFARVALADLHAAGHEVALVLSQPDRPGGRGMKLQASSVKQFALEHGLAVVQPRSLRLDGKYPLDAAQARDAMLNAQAQAMVVAAYGLILPQWVLDLPVLGCFNIHGSLLPRWRGAAPIHRAIEAGDVQTGITIMQMDAGLDTGDMLLAQALPIEPTDTTATLHDKLAALGGRMMVEVLQRAQTQALQSEKQATHGVSYAHKIEKAEALVDWQQAPELIVRRIRAFNPFPGASAVLAGESLKLWDAVVKPSGVSDELLAGRVVAVSDSGIDVAALGGLVSIRSVQRAGGKRLPVADFLRGFEVTPGMMFEKRAI